MGNSTGPNHPAFHVQMDNFHKKNIYKNHEKQVIHVGDLPIKMIIYDDYTVINLWLLMETKKHLWKHL